MLVFFCIDEGGCRLSRLLQNQAEVMVNNPMAMNFSRKKEIKKKERRKERRKKFMAGK